MRLFVKLQDDQMQLPTAKHPVILATRASIAAWTDEHWDKAQALRLFRNLLPDQKRALRRARRGE